MIGEVVRSKRPFEVSGEYLTFSDMVDFEQEDNVLESAFPNK